MSGANSAYDRCRTQEHYDLNYRPYIQANRDAAILDIGCGYGPFLEYLLAQGYHRLKGVELDQACVEACRQRLPVPVEQIVNLEDYLARESQRFDVVTLISVAVYWPHDQVVPILQHLKRLLAPGGRLIVEVPNGAALAGQVFAMKDWGLRVTFTEHTLRESLERAEYRIEALFGERMAVKSPKRLLWLVARRLWFACLAGVYLLEWGREPENPRILSKFLIAVARPFESPQGRGQGGAG